MLKIDCNSCDEEFEMAMDETIIYLYDDPQYNHFYTTCEHCSTPAVLFFEEPEFLNHGYPLVKEEEAPWHIRHIWAQLFDPENLPEERRTADEEMDLVIERRFHDWLEHIQPMDFDVST